MSDHIKIVPIVEHTESAMSWTPTACLQEAIADMTADPPELESLTTMRTALAAALRQMEHDFLVIDGETGDARTRERVEMECAWPDAVYLARACLAHYPEREGTICPPPFVERRGDGNKTIGPHDVHPGDDDGE